MPHAVSVSALSDHLMGHQRTRWSRKISSVSVSALSDHLMGQGLRTGFEFVRDCFSIRSFGSFDGTRHPAAGILRDHHQFQYPLFRII